MTILFTDLSITEKDSMMNFDADFFATGFTDGNRNMIAT